MELSENMPDGSATESSRANNEINLLIQNMERVIKGKRKQIELVITCLLAQGHILMEDNPGTGKTVLARTLAHSIAEKNVHDHTFKRIQFTPDLLPMDLIGTHIYDEKQHDFIFKKGPLFCNILLADEINRASPKVQSALLECMAEGQITIGDATIILEDLFFVIATQNPIEMEGTYPLPAAQLDRFFMKIFFGYVDADTELEIYNDYLQIQNSLTHLANVCDIPTIKSLQRTVENIFVHQEIVLGVANIVRATRSHPQITLGASTRSGISFLKCLRAFALVKGRDFVVEDDIQALAENVLDHRLIYRNKEGRANALHEIIGKEMERLQKLKLF